MSKHRAGPEVSDLDALLQLPIWTPVDVADDGRVLATWTGSGTAQLVEVTVDGDARLLTDLASPCTGRYTPDGRAVVVQHDHRGDERTQLSLVGVDPPPTEPRDETGLEPLVRDPASLHVLHDVRGDRLLFSTNRRDGVAFDLVVLDLTTRTQTTVLADAGYVAEAALAPAGDAVVVTTLSSRPCSTRVRVVATTGVSDVTADDEPTWTRGVGWAHDGRALLLSSNRDREHRAPARVAPDGTWTWLTESQRHDIDAVPSPDGTAMLLVRHVDAGTRLTLHDGHGHRVRDVPLPGDGSVTVHWSPSGEHVVIGMTAPRIPGDVLRLDLATGELETVVSSSDGSRHPALDRLVEPTSHRVPTPDGERIPCLRYRPAAATPPTPLTGAVVVVLHGGPEAQAVRAYDPLVQAMVASGLTVLVPNVRGSTGYGKRWYAMDDGRRRLDAVADLLALHTWLAADDEGVEDARRVALLGASYGGYLTLAGLTMQAWVWRAGVSVVGMSSLVTFLENTAPYRRAVREREYGSLERDRAFLEAASPLTYVDHLEAPLLVVHGANDPRVPLSESRQLVDALTAKDVPGELLVFDDEGHGLRRLDNRQVAYARALEFLGAHLGRPGVHE